ncbi:MAG: carbohydrate ABC transporter permease [Chloroflexi bacterium]|nr:carbohydrate ABC transporter permease [Chloroflexota bacterium]
MVVPVRERVLSYAILIAMAVLVLIPVVAGSLTAFKPQIIWISSPPVWFFEPTLENFEFVLITRQNWLHLRNSLIISIGSVVIALILGVPAAYGFARFRFRGSKGLMQWLISLRMIPPIVVGLPFYAMFLFLERATGLGLRDTHFGLILTYQTFLLPLVIWMMRGYFVELPAAMEESAMVEGYTRIGALWRVVLPVVWPGIVATALLNFIFAWNEFFLALILAGNNTSTLPMAAGTYIVRARVEWGNLFAVNLIIMMPVIVLTIFLRQQLVKGLTFGILE